MATAWTSSSAPQPGLESGLEPQPGGTPALLQAAIVVGLLFIFLCGVKGLGDGFKLLGRDVLDSFFRATSNPFLALVVGVLATTLVQNSSVSTSMIVGLVAAPENPLPIANAIPMVMGANVGTTVTNTIVALAHMRRPGEFQRAFSAATCHDFFNFLTVAILLPFEMATGLLRRSATALASLLGDVSGITYQSPFKVAIKTCLKPVHALAGAAFEAPEARAAIVIALSATLILVSLFLVVRALRSAMQAQLRRFVTRALGQGLLLSVAVGAVVTVMVQSSSITTSLLVPLAGAGIVTIHQVFPITVGANIGTTITALLASLAVSGANAEAGLVIALVHLLFNLTGTALILPIPRIRQIPITLAERLAAVAVRSPQWALFYVAALFFGLPALLVALHHWWIS